jgi:N-acetylglucosaminyldiphosphoundecaprenol N-acetyl-beta-D-mannosaminyltransferase
MMQYKQAVILNGYKIFIDDKELFATDISGVVNTINPHCYITARKDSKYRESLLASDYLIPDGIGIVFAIWMLAGVKIKRITGSDIHRIVLNYLESKNGSCFYFGSSQNALDKLKERLSKDHPGISAGFFSPPFKPDFSEEEDLAMIKTINDFNPEVLFVGMTAPRQEKWVHRNREHLKARIICPVGAVFDFYAGTVKRPGNFWLNTGLEWLPRLLREPGRLWKRTLISTPLFIWYVLLERIRLTFR